MDEYMQVQCRICKAIYNVPIGIGKKIQSGELKEVECPNCHEMDYLVRVKPKYKPTMIP